MYELSIGTKIGDLEWSYGVMAVILRYFSESIYDVVVKQLPRFQNLLLIVCDHINMICAIIPRLLNV